MVYAEEQNRVSRLAVIHSKTSHSGSPRLRLRNPNQPRFCGNHIPRKMLPQNRVRIVPPPARILGEQNTKEKRPFHFQKKFHPRQIKKARNIFLWCCREKRGSGGTIRAYDSIQSHHARLVRSLRSREQKPKTFLTFLLFFGGGGGGGRQKMERKFLVLLRRFRLLKEQSYFNIIVYSFLRPHGETRRFLSVLGGNSELCCFDDWSW